MTLVNIAVIYKYFETGIPCEPNGYHKFKCKVCLLIGACGHTKKDVPCVEAFLWAANNKLEHFIKQEDFINPVCKYQSNAPCFVNLFNS